MEWACDFHRFGRFSGSGRSSAAAGPTLTRGTVRFFDARKRFFGFITAADGRDVYVHRNFVKKGHKLFQGTQVEFVVAPTNRGTGLQAKKVKVVS